MIPVRMADAAPNPAAAEKPSVYGLANGLPKIVCMATPAIASAAPTTIANNVMGNRISQTITATVWSASVGATIASATSLKFKNAGPVKM